MVLLRSKRVPYALSVARSVTEQLTASCYLGVMEHLRSHGNNFVSIISPTPIKPISVSFPFQRHCPSATNRIHQYASRRCNESVSSTYRKSSLLFVSFLSSCLISACWIQERNIWISEWKRRLHRKYLIPSDFACFEASSPDTFWQIASLERASYEVISHRHRRDNYGRSSGIFFHYLSLCLRALELQAVPIDIVLMRAGSNLTPKTASTSVQRRRVVVGEGGKSEVRWKENQYHLTLDWALPGNAGRSGNISNWLSDVKKKNETIKDL